MKISCGVDIIEIDRIKKSFDQCGEAFKKRVYTHLEIEYCEARKASKFQSYAARFAAKEAVTKAFGTGISDGVSFLDIEVLNNEQGMPYVVLSGRAKEIFVSNCWNSISLSLSHCDSHAVAYTVLS